MFYSSISQLSPKLSIDIPRDISERNYTVELIYNQKIAYCNLKERNNFTLEKGSEVYVKYIDQLIDIDHLLIYFGQVGEVFQIRLIMTPDMHHHRGFAYVNYFNAAVAKKAVKQFHNKPLGNTNVSVELSLNNRTIFLGGVSIYKSKDEIWKQLQINGVKNLVDIIIYRGYDSKALNRGFGFLEFQTHQDAAIFRRKFAHNLVLWGRPTVIDWSIPMPEVDEELMKDVSNKSLKYFTVFHILLKHFMHSSVLIHQCHANRSFLRC